MQCVSVRNPTTRYIYHTNVYVPCTVTHTHTHIIYCGTQYYKSHGKNHKILTGLCVSSLLISYSLISSLCVDGRCDGSGRSGRDAATSLLPKRKRVKRCTITYTHIIIYNYDVHVHCYTMNSHQTKILCYTQSRAYMYIHTAPTLTTNT